MFSPPSSTEYDGNLGSKAHSGASHGAPATDFSNFSFTNRSNASVSSSSKRKTAAGASAAAGSASPNNPGSAAAHSSNLGIHSPISLGSSNTNDSQDTDESELFIKQTSGSQNKASTASNAAGAAAAAAAAAAAGANRKSSLDNDQFSLASSISRSSCNSRADDSLIFERLVQDPLTDAQPIPHSLPRHISSETFIPASLDTTTHMIVNNNESIDDLSNDDLASQGPAAVQFGFSSRRSSLANLEAALGGHSSAVSSRRPSIANLQSSFGMNSSYRLNSTSTNTLSRSQTNSSFSNLTQQFQNVNSTKRIPQSQPLAQSLSQNSQSSAQNTSPTNVSTLPPLTTTLTSSSVTSLSNQRNPSSSPMMKNKSFCSYADIIAQDDQDAKYPIRRPSISLSLSNQKLARTNSISSASQLCGCNSPRSPSNCSTSFANNFRSNANVSNILSPPNNISINNTNNISTSLNNKNVRGSPSVKSDSNYIPLPSFALESENRDYPINSINNNNNTPRRSGFSGRLVNNGGYSMRVTNSNSSYNSINNTSASVSSPSQNANGLMNLKKKELPSHPSRSLQNELISDDESIKSFKTANLPAE